MKYKHQNQTQKLFEQDAKNWSIKSNFKIKILNSIHERNFYVSKKLNSINRNHY